MLEVGELRHFHAVAPHFPAETPGTERRTLPVILDEANIVIVAVDADGEQALQIEVLDVGRRRLQDDLKLIIVLEPVRVLAIAAILGAARWLHVSRAPGVRTQRSKSGGRVERRRAHLHVIGLENDAALIRPEALKPQDQVLEGWRILAPLGFRLLVHVCFGCQESARQR